MLTLSTGLGLVVEKANAVLYPLATSAADGYLVVSSDRPAGTLLRLMPGATAYWQVAVRLAHTEPGSLHLAVSKKGTLAEEDRGLRMTVERCDEEWDSVSTEPLCTSGRVRVLKASPDDRFTQSSPRWDLNGISAGDTQYLLVALSLPAESASDSDVLEGSATVGLAVDSASLDSPAADIPATMPGALANTGTDVLSVLLVAIGLISAGASLSVARRLREKGRAT